ncbi:MAG: carbohydrate binding domain-containing protein [Fibrobacteria bacterium]|nr:carbohydrate binding domain-containing protein [Fibrobacteria bacterium]
MAKLRLLTATVAFSVLTVAAQDNLLPNPGFESGKTSWNLYVNSSASDTVGTPEATLTAPAAAARTGLRGAQVVVDGHNANNWDIQLQPPQTWKAEKGKAYHMTFWGKASTTKPMNVAAALGPAAGYAYLTGWEFSLGTEWKQYEVFYTSPATGVDSLRLNVYLGSDTGTYMFDDFILDTVPSALPTTMVQPAKGAWYTGVYRNLFAELGYSQAAVDAKVQAAFDQLFLNGDLATERLYKIAPDDTTMGFIDATDFVLTEGQSYGMMIALQMDRQDIFDKMWKFAKFHMQQSSGDRMGYFAWKVSTTPPYTPEDLNPAPDGEEYFVTALLFAAKRWGSKTGIFDYQTQADSLLGLITKEKTATMLPLIVPDRKQIVFSPAQIDDPYTDPSYHIPAFYLVWNELATDKKGGFYAEMADTSWVFLQRAAHPTTGLFPDYSTFDGVPKPTDFNANSHKFSSDAHRVGSNIGFSWAWFMDNTAGMTLVKKELGFFASQTAGYKSQYSLDGVADVEYLSQSLISANAAAVLASDRPSDWAFVDALWKLPVSAGQYRYYNGLLQMLNLLHCSGKFKAWGSPGLSTTGISSHAQAPSSLRLSVSGRTITLSGLESTARILDLRGRELSKLNPVEGTARALVPTAGTWIVDAGPDGRALFTTP